VSHDILFSYIYFSCYIFLSVNINPWGLVTDLVNGEVFTSETKHFSI